MTHLFPNVRFVLFDAVGTLIQVRPSVAEVYQAAGGRRGSRMTLEQIRRQFAEAFARHQDCGPTDEARERQRWRAIVSDVLHDIPHTADEVFEELWDSFANPRQWSLFPDVREVWEELSTRELTLGIASNFDSRLPPLCRALPPLDTVQHCFVSSDIGYPKPHAEFYRRVEQALGAPPQQILLVGDSLAHDVEGARSAGWHAIHLDRDHRHDSDSRIGSLTELLELL